MNLQNNFLISFLNPVGIDDYTGYFETILSVTGVLFGLAFTAIIFIMQNGFSSFQFNRKMFLEIYLHFGKNLLYSLAYIIVITLFALYLPSFENAKVFVFSIFSFLFTKSLLDHSKYTGYINTVFSTKYVPNHLSKIRKYFRFIANNGILHEAFVCLIIFSVVIYPAIISYSYEEGFNLTEKSIFYITLSLLIFSIVKIVNFIPEFFQLSNIEIESQTKKEHYEDKNIDLIKENESLEMYLKANEFDHFDPLAKNIFLDGNVYLSLIKDRKEPESWFNINIEVTNPDLEELFSEICNYAYDIFKLLQSSKTDINTFVLSFHINISGDKRRNIFFRTTRSELSSILEKNLTKEESVLSIENKLFDQLFRV